MEKNLNEKNITELRHDLKLSQPEFAKVMGTTVHTVQSWDKSKGNQPPEMAYKLAQLLIKKKSGG